MKRRPNESEFVAEGPDLRSDGRQRMPLVIDRDSFLENLCESNQRVAHLGCADSPYTLHRLETGKLLHSRLVQKADVTGFDTDDTGLEFLREAFPEETFVCVDISRDVPPEHRRMYDLVLATEVLEHVENPGLFLAGCRNLLKSDGALCVTVPNACSPKIAVRSLVGRENVHPDHHVYYGPRTLTRTLRAADFDVEEVATYLAGPGSLGRFANLGLRLSHQIWRGPVGEGLIVIARMDHETGSASVGEAPAELADHSP